MKRYTSILLSLVLCFGLCASAFAATTEETATADALYDLGLFKGTSTTEKVYELDKQLTRFEGYALLVRMLGAESDAVSGYASGKYTYTFTDEIADWAKPYVAYAQTTGLTKGVGDGTAFGGNVTLDDKMFLTMSLRALGYDESGGDFTWVNVRTFAAEKGLVSSAEENSTFDRGSCVSVFWTAMNTNGKGSTKTLATQLIDKGAITKSAFEGAVKTQKGVAETKNTATTTTGGGSSGGGSSIPAQHVCKHVNTATRVTKAATCGASGTSEKYCTDCSLVLETTTIPATGQHTHTTTRTTKAATCSASGTSEEYCTDCNTVLKTTTIPATGQHHTATRITKAATCGATGTSEKYCTDCNTVLETTTILATGQHTYQNGICTKCNATTTPATCQHTNTATRVTKAATCGASGTSEKYCTDCGAVLETTAIPATGQHHTATRITKAATCGASGTGEEYCTDCGTVLKTTTIPATGQHTHTATRTTKAATCGASGTSEEYCTDCNTVIETTTIPATGQHHTATRTTKAATCGASGTSEEYCTDCGTVLGTTPISATGQHTYKNGICTVCGKSKNELPIVPLK